MREKPVCAFCGTLHFFNGDCPGEGVPLSRDTLDALREGFAKTVVEAIEEYYPLRFFPKRTVELTATTSDCPMLRVDLGTGEIYNVTITRARK